MNVTLPEARPVRLNIGGLRWYVVEGAMLPSVTSVLSVLGRPRLAEWARNTALEAVVRALGEGDAFSRQEVLEAIENARQEPERIRDAAGDRGSAAHEDIAKAIASGEGPHAELVRALGLQPLRAEYFVFSRRHGFAGTCDLVAIASSGRLAVLDWKTGNVYPEHAFQIGAYAIALEEMSGLEVEAGYVVGLKARMPEIWMVDLARARAGFLAALELFRAVQAEGLLSRLRRDAKA